MYKWLCRYTIMFFEHWFDELLARISPCFSWDMSPLYRWKINVRWEVTRACASVGEWPLGNSSSFVRILTWCRLNVQTMMGYSKTDLENPNSKLFSLFKIRKLCAITPYCEFNPPFRLEMIDKHEKVAATFHSTVRAWLIYLTFSATIDSGRMH